MKTQLLEDIGQSATLSLVPSGRTLDDAVHKVAQGIPQARPAKPRSAFGVWRQKPEGEPVAPAAVETQHVVAEAVNDSAISPSEPTFGAHAPDIEPALQGPVFDFTPPPAATPERELFQPEPTWFQRSGKRYMLWGACVLAGALVVQGGLWFFDEPKAPALVTDELNAAPQADKVAKRRAIAVKEFTLGPDGEVSVKPATPPSAVPGAVSTVPPLVLLEATPVAPAAPVQAERVTLQTPQKRERSAQEARAAQVARRLVLARREQAVPPSKTAPARAQVISAETKLAPEAAMLKACREHGYQAAQCVKRACSVTKYGFVCRGK